jgi:hypothetical protein
MAGQLGMHRAVLLRNIKAFGLAIYSRCNQRRPVRARPATALPGVVMPVCDTP